MDETIPLTTEHFLPHIISLTKKVTSPVDDVRHADSTTNTTMELPCGASPFLSATDQTEGLSKNENLDSEEPSPHRIAVTAAPLVALHALQGDVVLSSRCCSCPLRSEPHKKENCKSEGSTPTQDTYLISNVNNMGNNEDSILFTTTDRQQVVTQRLPTPPSNVHLFAPTIPSPAFHSHQQPHRHQPHPLSSPSPPRESPTRDLCNKEDSNTSAVVSMSTPHPPLLPPHNYPSFRRSRVEPLQSVTAGKEKHSLRLQSAPTATTTRQNCNDTSPLTSPHAPLRSLSAHESTSMYKAFFDYLNTGYGVGAPAALHTVGEVGGSHSSSSTNLKGDEVLVPAIIHARTGASPMNSFYSSTQPRSTSRRFRSSLGPASQRSPHGSVPDGTLTGSFIPLGVNFMQTDDEVCVEEVKTLEKEDSEELTKREGK